jgi:hypothetical protein
MEYLEQQLIEARTRAMLEAGQVEENITHDPCFDLEAHQGQPRPHDVDQCATCLALLKRDAAFHLQQRQSIQAAQVEASEED